MVDARFLTVTVELFDRQHGVWCPACALPSAMTATFAVRIGDKLSLSVRTICQDCGGRP